MILQLGQFFTIAQTDVVQVFKNHFKEVTSQAINSTPDLIIYYFPVLKSPNIYILDRWDFWNKKTTSHTNQTSIPVCHQMLQSRPNFFWESLPPNSSPA